MPGLPGRVHTTHSQTPVLLQVLLQNGRLKMGHKQQPLRSKGEAGGAFVVISGIVRLTGQTAEGVPLDEAYLAAGLSLPVSVCMCTCFFA